jgi:hypothetical protein
MQAGIPSIQFREFAARSRLGMRAAKSGIAGDRGLSRFFLRLFFDWIVFILNKAFNPVR